MQEISVRALTLTPIHRIGREWMLITAGTRERGYNTMTASWGHLGSLWGEGGGMPTAVIYIRPQRYTKQFVDREAYFTLSFFPEGYKEQLAYLGAHSGRDEDKIAKVGLTPLFEADWTLFAQANLTLVCRKLYRAPILEAGFVDRAIVEQNYPQRDFHDMYVGQIVQVLTGEGA